MRPISSLTHQVDDGGPDGHGPDSWVRRRDPLSDCGKVRSQCWSPSERFRLVPKKITIYADCGAVRDLVKPLSERKPEYCSFLTVFIQVLYCMAH